MSVTVFLFFFTGLILGSFGNVLLLRVPAKKPLTGRSRCMSCARILSPIDLIPVLSYALLGGRCRKCGAHIAIQYPLVEILSAALFALPAILYPDDLVRAILTAALLYFLLLASVFDLRSQKLPDIFTIAIAIIGAAIAVLTGSILSSLEGAALAFVWFGGQWVLSRKRAVGTGDIFLSMALALWLGFKGTVSMLALSYMVGAVIVLLLLVFRVITWKQQRIAFGPFLALGALLTLLGVGDAYLRLIWYP